MDVDLRGLTGRLVLPAAVLERPHELLLLGVDADHGLAGASVLGDLGCQVTELGVPVGMLIAFGGLGVALQAEPERGQHPGDRPVRDGMPYGGQRPCQVAGRLRRPHQQRHRISPSLGVHQRLQPCEQPRVGLRQLLTAAARASHPSSRLRITRKLPDSTGNGVWMRPRRLRDRLDPAPTQLGSLRTQHQTSLPLIQMPAQNRVPTSNGLRYPRAVGHSTTI